VQDFRKETLRGILKILNLIIIHNSEADEDAAVNLFLFSNPVRCRKIPHLFLSGKETENET
jgi:hypothetical protein